MGKNKLDDVLLPLWSEVKADVGGAGEDIVYVIIGKRVINESSMKVWDYIAIPREEGLVGRDIKNSNCVFFNHYDIYTIEN